MVERTRAIRYVHLGGNPRSSQLYLTTDVIVQVPGRSRRRLCYASPTARRAHDQADIFCLRTHSRGNEEVASQFVLIRVHLDLGISRSTPDAYWTQETLDRLLTVDDIPELRSLEVPPGMYLCARTNRMRETASRSTRSLFSDGSVVPSPSSPPGFLPYPSHRHPDERGRSSSLCPSSPNSSHAETLSPCMFADGEGLSLAPLEMLEECRRFPRDPTDVLILRSFT